MELEEIIYSLKAISEGLFSSFVNIDCYLFGSVLTRPKLANDIDILIVYNNLDHLNTLKRALKVLVVRYPLHICYFTYLEEKELNFIKEQKAVRLFSL